MLPYTLLSFCLLNGPSNVFYNVAYPPSGSLSKCANATGTSMNRWLFWITVSVGLLLVSAFAGLSFMAGGPMDAIEMVRFALPQMHMGTLKAGDAAPDVRLVALDGRTRFSLHERTGGRPLVLIFGSFT
jgi:hypothetical protein